jgi:general secretion pathway protein D
VRRGEVSFNFDDADVYSVIQTIFGDVLKVNYIVDPNVKGRVTFRSVEPVSKESVLPLMEVILRLNGIGIVEEGGLYRIVPIADISKEPAPVGLGRDPEKVIITGKARVQVVQVKYIQSAEMVRVLTPFLSKNAVIVDVPKSNYVIIVDTDANVKRLLELVKIFDSEELKEVTPKVFVYPVQNSKAKDVASLLQQIFQGQKPTVSKTAAPTRATLPGQQPHPAGQPAPAQPQISMGQQGGEALVSEVTKIIPDEVTNSVIVLATPEDYALIYDTIQRIDIPPRQVMIEGLIIDITLSDNLSYGLAYSINTSFSLHPFKKDWDLSGPAQVNPGGLNVNASPSPIPSGGFSFIGSDPSGNVRAVLTALEDQSRAKVVAAPHILVSDNREARIQIGQQVPLATSQTAQITTTTTNVTNTPVLGTTTVQYKDIGIILKVKPQVNDSGLISLELSQEISAISSKTVTVGGLGEVAIDKTEATSNLVARDGETIIIGGLIREDNNHGSTGIPFLSSIPILGALFGSKSDTVTRKETIILLTPHVIRNQQEAGEVTSDYIKRYKGATKDKEIDKLIRERTGGGKAPVQDQPVTPQAVPGN